MGAATDRVEIAELVDAGRDEALPVLEASFDGYYRWHARRALREVTTVRAARRGGTVVGVALLDQIAAAVGYVFYLAVAPEHRRRGLGTRLLDDALQWFRSAGDAVVYAAVGGRNVPSRRLFGSRGFREVRRDELDHRLGGLGARELHSRMRLVWGEVLLGLRLASAAAPAGPPDPGPGTGPPVGPPPGS